MLVLILYRKHVICLKDYRIRSFLSIQYVHGDLCKHLGIDSSTDLDDRYSNLFLNANINRHVDADLTIDLRVESTSLTSFKDCNAMVA